MTTTTEKTAAIRTQLKAHGWSSRKVSVRAERCTYSSSIEVRIKDPEVNIDIVRDVVDQYESVRRCEVTHEILSGGNTFTHVSYTREAREALAGPHVEALRAAMAKVDELSDSTLVEVDGTEGKVSVGKDGVGGYRLWTDRAGMHVNTPECGAFFVAGYVRGWKVQ